MRPLLAGLVVMFLASVTWAAAPGDPVKTDAGLISGTGGKDPAIRLYAGVGIAGSALPGGFEVVGDLVRLVRRGVGDVLDIIGRAKWWDTALKAE